MVPDKNVIIGYYNEEFVAQKLHTCKKMQFHLKKMFIQNHLETIYTKISDNVIISLFIFLDCKTQKKEIVSL